MSLILDALKKSEQQRQREKAPGLQSIHQPIAPAVAKKPRLGWLVAIVIICNIAFFGYWFWRPQSAVLPIAQNKPASTEVKPTDNSALPQTNSQAAVTIASTPEFTQISPNQNAVQSAPAAAAQHIEEVNELPDDVRNNLPAMTFSFHVYSENPQQRTIIINNRRVREGDEISAGLQLQQITEDGVVLLFSQHRVHISVLSGW